MEVRRADHVIATDKQDIAEEVAKITDGKGAYGAMDAIGGTTTNELLKSIRRWGTVIVYGEFFAVINEDCMAIG